jgi:hypothetical protein
MFTRKLFKSVSAGVIVISLSMLTLPVSAGASDLSEGFQSPPAQSKPHVYWFWMSGNITREGITADLEAMAASGIGGALIFNVGETHGTEEDVERLRELFPRKVEMLPTSPTGRNR